MSQEIRNRIEMCIRDRSLCGDAFILLRQEAPRGESWPLAVF